MRALHRRGLLGRAVALALAAKPALAAAKSANINPDASLIAWCTAFSTHRDQIEAAYRAAPDNDWSEADAAANQLEVEMQPLVSLICTTMPTTIEGVRAVAGALLRSMPEVDPLRVDEPCAPDEHRLQVALLRGLLRGGIA